MVTGHGVGLHSGQLTRVRLVPTPPDSGIVFVRTDLVPNVEIPATSANVRDTVLATTLGVGAVTVATVEHLIAALAGLGVDNARVELDGPEVPILDGSSAPWVQLITEAGGTVAQRKAKRFLVVRRAVEVRADDKWARLEPANTFSLRCSIDFDHPIVNSQSFEMTMSDTAFLREVARARTFGFAKDVDAMHAAGLARGGSLDNAVVIDDFSIRNLTEMASAFEEGTQTFTTLLAAIAAVSLLVGGIGIMNIMLVSVTERTREIGLRMAVGAKPRDILSQFLIESLILSLTGGIIGVLIGVLGAQFLTSKFGWSVAFSPQIIALAVGFSALVGVAFGLYPAQKASRLDPIEALRYE
ncbi:MAG: UDP-3-O-[3-hydroxymyristoyl] N-acetylglucosamine deacetylase [Myxococcales bacterium]|nr:UDP-3-O-[3-hydroxymyristoyl] N-acetylglucosamine deacetylase [Myxococcales bacterium]